MMSNSAEQASAEALAGRVRNDEVSARELVEAMLARIEEHNPALNALVEVRGEEALAAADRAYTIQASGARLGALHGVPITVKEAIDVAGFHTTWGDPDHADHMAEHDAAVIARLREAGAIVVATSNVALMLSDFGQTSNPLYGTTSNPWDLSRSPGGSSGGAAAAVAAGLTTLEVGSDLVGSIRIPAAMCGVYGLRPSSGTVDLAGFAPPGVTLSSTPADHLSTLGPLAGTAADIRIALQLMTSPTGASPAGRLPAPRLPAPRYRRLEDFRVGVVLDDPHCPVTAAVGDVLSDLTDQLAQDGVTLLEGWPDGFDPGESAALFGAEVESFFAFQNPNPSADPSADSGPETLSAFQDLESRRANLMAVWADFYRHVDVLVCPTTFTTAAPHDDRPFEQRTLPTPRGDRPYTDLVFWIAHPAIAGLPALAAPVGLAADGLPVGAQCIGPAGEDDTAITFAERVAESFGASNFPPSPGSTAAPATPAAPSSPASPAAPASSVVGRP